MKLSLEEARKRATQTKLRVREGTADICEAEGPRTIAFAYSTHEGEEQVYNAALLVHAWNHFDKVVAALEDMLFQFDGTGYEDDKDRECIERAAAVFTKAKTVEMP